MTGVSCSPACRFDVVEDITVVHHASDCSYLAGWSWPIPPEHAGPCACRRQPGSEHFTEHTPIGCSIIPSDLAERLLARRDADFDLAAEELQAISDRNVPIVAWQRERYG